MSDAFSQRSFGKADSPFQTVWATAPSIFRTKQPDQPREEQPVDGLHFEDDLQDQLDDSYRKGFADGQAAIAQANEELMACSERLAAAVTALKPQPGNALCETLLRSIRTLLERTAGFSSPDAQTLQRHCASLAAMAEKDCSNAILHIHPMDRALLGEQTYGLTLEDDPSLTRGTLSLCHSDGWIEQGTQPVLDELEAMLASLNMT